MSMFDSFFNKGFKGSKCKTLLKLTIPRIKLLRNRRELQIKQMRKEIANLLETDQEATARIRVEHIIREENMMAAQEIIELFCELISVRLPIIEYQRECPLDLKEAISSVCFAAPRCADLPELLQVQLAFASKYGKEFIAAATELMPDCGVNRQLIELLSVRAPPAEKRLKLLKEIAEEHGLDWAPAASEAELFKSHEDLLDGTKFASGSKVPLPKEKHEEVLQSASIKPADEQSDSDSSLDSLEFPEVPKAILRSNTESGSTKEEKDTLQASDHALPRTYESRQFLPFISPPPPSSQPVSFEETVPSFESLPRVKSETTNHSPQSLPAKSEINLDLQDVLVAAQAAAETAERAATAARSAAILARVKISELSNHKHSQSLDSLPDNPFGMDTPSPSATNKEPDLNCQISSADSDDSTNVAHPMPEHHHNNQFTNGSSGLPTYDANESSSKTSSFGEVIHEQVNPPPQQPHRMTSMEDDPLSSYPNLFGSGSHSFAARTST